MPTYTYNCKDCQNHFHVVENMADHKESHPCPLCKSTNIGRDYKADNMAAVGSASIPKTLGFLADKNSDKMSEDEKNHLTEKHTEYMREGKQEHREKLAEHGIKVIDRPKEPPLTFTGEKPTKKRRKVNK